MIPVNNVGLCLISVVFFDGKNRDMSTMLSKLDGLEFIAYCKESRSTYKSRLRN